MNLSKPKRVLLIIILSIVGVLVILNLYFLLNPQFGRKPDKLRMEKFASESKFEKGKFRNIKEVPVMLPKSYGKMIKLSMKKKEGRRPENPLPSVKPQFDSSLNDTLTSVIWLGHSSVYIKMSGIKILTDPVFSKRASPVSFIGPQSFELEYPFTPEDLPIPDIILISHDHFDHLDYKIIKKHYLDVKLFVVPLGIRDHLEKWGVSPDQIREFDWWQEEIIMDDLTFAATPSQHFSGRQKQDNSTLWCSWVIQNSNEKIFFSGDSGYDDHFSTIGEKYGPFDLTLMECGAYGKYWPKIHMIPEESVQAGIDVKAKVILPIHWGKFNLAFHPWTEPIERFIKESEAKGLQITTPLIGEEIVLGSEMPTGKWWER